MALLVLSWQGSAAGHHSAHGQGWFMAMRGGKCVCSRYTRDAPEIREMDLQKKKRAKTKGTRHKKQLADTTRQIITQRLRRLRGHPNIPDASVPATTTHQHPLIHVPCPSDCFQLWRPGPSWPQLTHVSSLRDPARHPARHPRFCLS